MNLWLSSHFLVAGLFLSSWALTPEECQPSLKPLSLTNISVMYGRWNFIAAYTDNELYNTMLEMSQSSWMNVTMSTSNPNQLESSQGDMMNGTCMSSKVNITIEGNTMSVLFGNISSSFHLLPSCDGCLLFDVNSTARDLDKFLQMLNINRNTTEEEIKARGLYLMANGTTVKDSDLENFKQQASCLGFTREPDFLYDPKNGFCAEGEGLDLTAMFS